MNTSIFEELFSANNYLYWVTIVIIFILPILLKIINKINVIFIQPKENFDVVISNFTNEYHRYSIFGKQKSYYEVEFEVNPIGKAVLKREHDLDNKQVFRMPVSEEDHAMLKKIGLKQEIGLNAMFSKSRFGHLTFLKFNNKVDYSSILKERKQKNNATNSKNLTNNKIMVTSQYDLQRKYMKNLKNVKASNDLII